MIEKFRSDRLIRTTEAYRFGQRYSVKHPEGPVWLVSELNEDFNFTVTVTDERREAEDVLSRGGFAWIKLQKGKEIKREGGMHDVD